MATVTSHNLNSKTGVTEIVDTGSVTASSGGGRNFLRIVGSGSWDSNGFSVDTTFTGTKAQVIYWSAQTDGTNVLMGLTETQTLSQSAMIGIGFTGGNIQAWTGGGFAGGTLAFSASTWYDFMLIIAHNGDIQSYARASASNYEDSDTWTYLHNTTQATNFDPIDATLYFTAQSKDTPTVTDIDNFVVTDNGYEGSALSGALIYSNEMDDKDDITEVTGTGSNDVVTRLTRTIIDTTGQGAWNVNGWYKTTKMATGAMGHTIYFDLLPNDDVANGMLSIRQDAAIAYATATAHSFYYQNSRFAAWGHLITASDASTLYTPGSIVNCKAVIEASGRTNHFYHQDDGTLPWELDASDWTWKSLSNSQTFRGGDIFISINHNDSGATHTCGVDRLYYTANGTVPAATNWVEGYYDGNTKLTRIRIINGR